METIPLLCLPYAGAGASFFMPWQSFCNHLQIIPVKLPGREKRFSEPAYCDINQATAAIMDELPDLLKECKQVAIFGHSMGAILAYELTRHIINTTDITVLMLIASGSHSPLSPRTQRATGLDDQAFLKQIETFAGYQHPALQDPLLCELLLPVLRADVEMHENYTPPFINTSFDIPVMTVRGNCDNLVSNSQIQEWQKALSIRPLPEK